MASKKQEPTSESSPIKFIRITGGADGLYALSEDGKVFIYDDEDEGWFQLEYDNTRALADAAED